MAVEALTRFTCDRCKNIIQETQDSSASQERGYPLLYLEAQKFGRPALRFDDLCDKCEARVAALLDQLDLSKPSAEASTEPPPENEGDSSPKKKSKKNKPPAEDRGPEDPEATF